MEETHKRKYLAARPSDKQHDGGRTSPGNGWMPEVSTPQDTKKRNWLKTGISGGDIANETRIESPATGATAAEQRRRVPRIADKATKTEHNETHRVGRTHFIWLAFLFQT